MSIVRILESKIELDILITKNDCKRPLIAKFFSPECEPCRIVSPWFYEFARENNNRADFVSINVNLDPEIAKSHGLPVVPMFAIWMGGELIDLYSRNQAADLRKTLDLCTRDRTLVLKIADCVASQRINGNSSPRDILHDELDRDLEEAFADIPKKRAKSND